MSNKSRLQTNNTNLQELIGKANALPDAGSGSGEDLDSVITELETKVATLNTTLDGKAAGGGDGGSAETSVVTINTPVLCKYLGIDFQAKEETTSVFEAVKNSMVVIGSGIIINSSGCSFPVATGAGSAAVMQLDEAVVTLTIATGGGGAD